jgi:hypothetical protein
MGSVAPICKNRRTDGYNVVSQLFMTSINVSGSPSVDLFKKYLKKKSIIFRFTLRKVTDFKTNINHDYIAAQSPRSQQLKTYFVGFFFGRNEVFVKMLFGILPHIIDLLGQIVCVFDTTAKIATLFL